MTLVPGIRAMAHRLTEAYHDYLDAALEFGAGSPEEKRTAQAVQRRTVALDRLLSLLPAEPAGPDGGAPAAGALQAERDVLRGELATVAARAEQLASTVAAVLGSRDPGNEGYHDHHLLNRIAHAWSDYRAATDQAGSGRR